MEVFYCYAKHSFLFLFIFYLSWIWVPKLGVPKVGVPTSNQVWISPCFFLKNLASYMLKFISAVYVSLVQHINEKLIIKGLTFCIKWHFMAQWCFKIAKILTSVTYVLCFSFTSNSKFTPILTNIACRRKVIYELTLCQEFMNNFILTGSLFFKTFFMGPTRPYSPGSSLYHH